MNTLTIFHVGDYPQHRELALRLKAGGELAAKKTAELLQKMLPPGPLLLMPLPSHTGRPTYMLHVAQLIATMRKGDQTKVFSYLRTTPHESRHALKHGGISPFSIEAPSMRFANKGSKERYNKLTKQYTPILLDDIADTGASLRSAQLLTGDMQAAVLDITDITFLQ